MDDTTDLPLFPTSAPATFADRPLTRARFASVLAHLAEVVEVDPALVEDPTPCRDFTVGGLRRHVLAWLQFFAAALNDPAGATVRLDPETWELGADQDAAEIVRRAAADIDAAIVAGAADVVVRMAQARMAGDGVLAMALGEYLVHGWDLAVATGRAYRPDEGAAEPALEFLTTMVAPEHRGVDGFFDDEVEAPPTATPFNRLLCFAGRDPDWQPPRVAAGS